MTEGMQPSVVVMSPVSQLLSRLGMTREDLSRHSDQMRQFLVADDAAFPPERAASPTPTPSAARERASSRSFAILDASGSGCHAQAPSTPVKSASNDTPGSGRKLGSMEAVIERQNAIRRGHGLEDTVEAISPSLRNSTSFSATRSGPLTRSRVFRRDTTSGEHTGSCNDVCRVSYNFFRIY
jgi:hypothetical protein